MTTVIHHSADYDGIFCREIARKFLPAAQIIGWDFGQPKIPVPEGDIYILDLPPDCLQWIKPEMVLGRIIWIDHHKSSIEKYPASIKGYRIDGVAACRLAWQYFTFTSWIGSPLPDKEDFLHRKVDEPMAVTLAGEYDIWDHKTSGGMDLALQFGLDSVAALQWHSLLNDGVVGDSYTLELVKRGEAAQQCYKTRDGRLAQSIAFNLQFEGLSFMAMNTPARNSKTFDSKFDPEIHDAKLAFFWNGKIWIVSMYSDNPELDLSQIAVKHGGGGHRGACGFQSRALPWL